MGMDFESDDSFVIPEGIAKSSSRSAAGNSRKNFASLRSAAQVADSFARLLILNRALRALCARRRLLTLNAPRGLVCSLRWCARLAGSPSDYMAGGRRT